MLGGRVAHVGTLTELTAAGVDLGAYVPPPAEEGSEEPASPAPRAGRPSADGGASLSRRASADVAAPPAARRASKDAALPAAPAPPARSAASVLAPFLRMPSFFGSGPRGQGLVSFASHKPFTYGGAGGAAAAAAGAAGGGAVGDAAAAAADAGLEDESSDAWLSDEGEGDEGADADAPADEEAGVGKSPSGKGGRRGLGRLIKAEHRARGQVKRSVYLAYLAAWGPLFLLPITIFVGARRRRRRRGSLRGSSSSARAPSLGARACAPSLSHWHEPLPRRPPPPHARRRDRRARAAGVAELCALPLVQRDDGGAGQGRRPRPGQHAVLPGLVSSGIWGGGFFLAGWVESERLQRLP
jgi:hypothetical protein